MLKNYINTIIRNIQRNKLLTAINMVGLSLGLAAFIVIAEYVKFETHYDSYNENVEEIFRLGMKANLGDADVEVPFFGAPPAGVIKNDFPEVVDASRLFLWTRRDYNVVYEDLELKEKALTRMFGDPNFFNFFSLELLVGNQLTALAEPNSIVLTESTALKYFGTNWREKDIIGEVLKMEALPDLQITGIVQDVPEQTHFTFNFLISLNTLPDVKDNHWFSNAIYHYFQIRKDTEVNGFLKRLDARSNDYLSADIKDFLGQDSNEFFAKDETYFNFFLQPMQSIHLDSHYELELAANGDKTYVTTFRIVSMLVLLMAAINFMNLSTVAGLNRNKEVGVRKVLGALKGQLIFQFLLESIMLTLTALVFAITIVQLSAPMINGVVGLDFIPTLTDLSSTALWMMLGAVMLGVVTGLYPALHFSSFSPLKTLKGAGQIRKGKDFFRNGLIVFQFSISLLLIIGFTGIHKQISHMQTIDLGYAKDQILIVNNVDELGEQAVTLKNLMKQEASVNEATLSGFVPIGSNEYGMSGYKAMGEEGDQTIRARSAFADEGFVETYELELLGGRSFSADFGTEEKSLLVNEEFVKGFNWTIEEAIGKRVQGIGSQKDFTIIGVVKNFQVTSMKYKMQPFTLEYFADQQALALSFDKQNWLAIKDAAQVAWKSLTDKPFSYTTANEMFETVFEEEKQASNLFSVFSILSVLIGGLGLFGVASYVMVRRSKEVGIRKILGASVPRLLLTLSKSFMVLLLGSGLIAIPLAYYFLKDWVGEYAYQTDMSLWLFVAPFAAIVLLALLIVLTQVLKVALVNPIKSLRYE